MAFIGNLLGLSGTSNAGSSGQNYQASNLAMTNPTNADQLAAAYQAAQSGLTQQNGLVGATSNGLTNQNNAYAQQQAFLNALQAQGGANNQTAILGQQQALANQLQGVANGTGPNPAMAALNQQTGNNVANQAALMAGQRGSNANVGLMSRQIAQQGANTQQQAVGQGATLEAQQQLGAMGQLGTQQQAMQGVAGTQVAQQATEQGNLANLASQQAAQQLGAVGTYNQAAQSEQQGLNTAQGQYNSTAAGLQSNVNNANAGIANTVAQGQSSLLGGLLGGGGSGIQLAHGGMVPQKYASGGSIQPAQTMGSPSSFAGRFFQGMGGISASQPALFQPSGSNQSAQDLQNGVSNLSTSIYNKLGNAMNPLPNNVGENLGTLQNLNANAGAAVEGENSSGDQMFNKGGRISEVKGGRIPGKAKGKTDSYKDDTVPILASSGEFMIPKSIMESSDPVKNSAKFVAAYLAKKRVA